MKIKAIIFDLDETLYDGRKLTESGLRQAIQVMIKNGLNTNLEEGLKKIKEIIKENPPRDKFRDLAKAFNQENEEIISAGYNKYINSDFDELDIYPETKEVLSKLNEKFKLGLISQGSERQQNKKVDVLGIREYFDFIVIPNQGEKKEYFVKAIENLRLKPEEILVVGDEITTEIKIGNELGMKTVRLLKGKYKSMIASEKNEKADFEINNLTEILDIVN